MGKSLPIVATVSRGFCSAAITGNPQLEDKTLCVVLYQDTELGGVYRESSDAPGQYSRDEHQFANDRWKQKGKAFKKYFPDEIVFPPPDCFYTLIQGVEVYTNVQPTDEVNEWLRRRIFIRKQPKP